jgi:hypothetical protein
MAVPLELALRRQRRLLRMRETKSVERANTALTRTWNAGRRPAMITLRATLLLPDSSHSEDGPQLTQLIRSKGVALRFYLLAVFDAQCRLQIGEPWSSDRALSGYGSWSDCIAIDGAYRAQPDAYMIDTIQDRDADTLRLRQVQGALKTLEEMGSDGRRGLVTVPRTANGRNRVYQDFRLMNEDGRGALQTPNAYTVPPWRRNGSTLEVPVSFFLQGWIQVLNSTEVATWLILQWLSQNMPDRHDETGVYLYAKRREQFGLARDAWEDSCNRLREFGLIRYAGTAPTHLEQGDTVRPVIETGWGDPATMWDRLIQFAQPAQIDDRYEPNHYQMSNEGLDRDALDVLVKEFQIRTHGLSK